MQPSAEFPSNLSTVGHAGSLFEQEGRSEVLLYNYLCVHASCAGLHEHAQSVHVRCRGECARVGTHWCRHLFLGQKVFAYCSFAIR